MVRGGEDSEVGDLRGYCNPREREREDTFSSRERALLPVLLVRLRYRTDRGEERIWRLEGSEM